MKGFKTFLNEEDKTKNAKQSVVNTIVSNFQRFANSSKEGDVAALTMLTAAISILGTSDSPQAVQAARRLAQMAAQRAGRSK